MKLVVVESPTKAKTLTKFLGSGYQIEASMGHVRDLPKSKIGVDVEHDFEPVYEVVKGKHAVITKLKQLAKTSTEIILATDLDREGEAIAWHIQEILGKQKFSRITFHEITKEAITNALKNPGQVDLKLVDAQFGRRVLDRLVGYKLSPILWQKVRRGLSAGRVQSVAVRLIVEREEEIANFKPEPYWIIGAKLQHNTDQFTAYLKKITAEDQAQAAIEVLNQAQYEVKKVTSREAKIHPLPPLITSTMQRTAGARLGWSAKKTMREAQHLYEEGLITYHRTDSVNLSQEALAKARDYIQKNLGASYLPPQAVYYKGRSQNVQGAHEAIRPTDVNLESDNKLYQLIRERFLASQTNPVVVERTVAVISAGAYELKAEGERLVFDGWWRLGRGQKLENPLPPLKPKDKLDLVKLLSEKRLTAPRPRYSEASLIKVLEEKGIGRPSTYAPILSTIQDRQYVEKKEKQLWPTPIGTAVVKFLMMNFAKVMDYEFTAKMETDLDEIAKGNLSAKILLKNFYKDFDTKLKEVIKKAQRMPVEVEKTGDKCPDCSEGEVVIRTGRFGKFLSCSRFPDCKYTKNYKEIVKGVLCPECQAEVVVKKSRRGKQFYGCANYPKCKWASWNKPKVDSSSKK